MKKFTLVALFAVMTVMANAVTVYFHNADNWSKVNAYAWKGSGTTTLGGWPGTQMTAVDGQEGWFQIDVKDAEKVIFNNGSGTQTNDLTVNAAKPYYKDGGWADSFGGEAVVVKNKIYFKNNDGWSKVNAYAWNGISTGSWPGAAMTPVAGQEGWYEIEVIGDINGASIIFNDGSKQTDDLTIDGTKPYYNNGWTDGFGGAVVPADSKYFLKHPFDGTNWEWKEMTKQDDGTYTLVANWNGIGANINSKQDDANAQWKEAATISGAPSTNGVEVTYVYDPVSGTLSITTQAGGDDDIVTPTDSKYFVKHPFNGTDWEWKEMTKQENGTYTLVANWNGGGVNVNTKQDDAGAQWNPAELISGAPNATNVEVTYVYDPATGALHIVYTGEDIQITYYITGNAAFHTALGIEGEWNPALKVFENEITFIAVAGTEYTCKFTDGTWEKTWGNSVVDATCSNVTTTTDDSGNIIFTLEADATVTISFDGKKACINKVDLPSALENAVAGRVFAENGILRAVLDQAALVEVFSLNGVLLDSQVSADYNVALAKGMYIVRINGKAQKVVLY